MMRKKKIEVLAIQESHLTEASADQISTLFDKKISLYNSSATKNPSASAGVAFVINKELVNIKSANMTTLIPVRVTYLSLEWQQDGPINLLNVYAPTNLSSHPTFWAQLKGRWQDSGLPKPHLLLGDFNVTKDLIDRAPTHLDNTPAAAALRDCRHSLNVHNAWRAAHLTDRTFTHISPNNTMSRWNVTGLECKINHLEKKRYKSAHLCSQATWQTKGESINKYWMKVNNPKHPRDLICHLRNPTTNRLEMSVKINHKGALLCPVSETKL